MHRPQNAVFVLILVVLLSLPGSVIAQFNWARISTPSAMGITPHTIDAADGIVVLGGNGVVVSTDLGYTWRNCTPNITNNPNFVGIAIYDRNIFAVQTGASGIYITHDQGRTWRPLLRNGGVIPSFPLLFMNDPSRILCMGTNGSFVYTSNGGVSFTTTPTSLSPYQLKLAADGTVRLFSRTDFDVRTATSSDTGKTWVESAVLPYKDCYSVIADPLDPNIHCLVNEEFYFRQHPCMIFRTSNNGATWDTTFTHSLSYLAGSSDRGCTDYFVSTVSDGIMRSTDQGVSWHTIGGPSVLPDYRNLVAADDSLIFALDQTQSLWSSRPVSNTWKIKVRNNLGFTEADFVSCDSVHTGMVIVYPGCDNAGIQQAQIVGPNADRYEFLDGQGSSFPDTLKIRFTSSGPGVANATLKVRLADGSNYDFDLSAITRAPELLVSPQILMEDTITLCQTISDTLKLSSLCPMQLTGVEVLGMDSASFSIVNIIQKSLPQDSVMILRCVPTHLGQLDGQLRITTQYGRVHIIPMRPVIKRIPLTVFYDTVYARDSLWQCQTARDTIRIRSGCAVTDVTVGLIDSSAFHLLSKRTLTLPQDSLVVIEYTSGGKTDIGTSLTFRSSTLEPVNIPVKRLFKRAPVTLKTQPKLFAGSFSFCNPILDTLIFVSPCPHIGSNIHFEGPDAAKFTIVGMRPLHLPDSNIIIISCTTNQPGQLNADLVFETQDKVINRYRLQPVFIVAPFRFIPASLFSGDSVGACVGAFDTLRFSSDCSIKVKSITLSGTDAGSFALSSTAPLQFPKDSLIIVRCLAGAKGKRIAALRVELEDGRVWNIPLSAEIVDAPLKLVPPMLFAEDTLSKCSFGLDSLHLFAPCPITIKDVTIGGADAALFQIEGSKPIALPGDSILIVRCTPDRTGALAAYVRVESTDGRVWTIPIACFASQANLSISHDSLFIGDTISLCGSLSDTTVLIADCDLKITSLSVSGPDASAFTLTGATSRQLPADPQIVMVCTPSHSGLLNAVLEVQSEDGRSWKITLQVYVDESPVTLSATTLFAGQDSVYDCTSLVDTLHLSSLCPVSLTSVGISGSDASAFTSSMASAFLPADSLIVVTFMPSHGGRHTAQLVLQSSDGRTWVVDLSANVKPTPLALDKLSLFDAERFTLCETREDTLYLSTVCPVSIASVSISGPDRLSFRLLSAPAMTIPNDSAVIVECRPVQAGALTATLDIITSDGRAYALPLTASISDYASISVAGVAEAYTDTLGGEVLLPITINQTIGSGTIGFTLHHSSTLEYLGTFDESGVDRTLVATDGVARVEAQVADGTQLYAKYLYFPLETDCAQVTCDSISTGDIAITCLTTSTNAFTMNVCASGFCGRDDISSFLRYGKTIRLVVTPNPSQGDISIHADRNVDADLIEIVDGAGGIRKRFEGVQVTQKGLHIGTSDLASGIYEIVVHSEAGLTYTRFVLSK